MRGCQWIEKHSEETARVGGFLLNQLKILDEGRPE